MKSTHFCHPALSLQSLVLALVLLFSTQSFASLVLNPQRIVLQDRERSASLDLLNTSEEMGRYQIYFEHKYMKEDGSIVDIANPSEGGPYAGDMIRYSPRRVDIPAGGSQTIRLAARRPKDLNDGEYLSHLVLKQIPNKAAQSENPNSPDAQLNLAVQPVLKIAIPVIVRKGNSETSAHISDVKPILNEQGVEALHFTLNREGKYSLYGNVELFEKSQQGLGKRVGYIRGIALYTPTAKRLVKIHFNETLPKGPKEYLLRFSEDEKFGGTNMLEKNISF
jgi:fimbrial chaperone protein